MNKLKDTLTTSVTKYCCLVGILLSIVSCQSTMDRAGEYHKTAAAKWYALANYARSDIQRYGVTITGKLSVDFNDPQQSFKLSNFKLSTVESINNINLLMPTFENKHICVKQCYQLLEYINTSGQNGSTLLTSYFSDHEFELFKFYGEIQILNEQMVNLARTNKVLLSAYLKSLAYKDLSFQTAKEFTQYLANVLTLAKFNHFIVDPSEVLLPFIANYEMRNSELWTDTENTEQNNWISPKDIQKEQWQEGEPEEYGLLTVNAVTVEAPWLNDGIEEQTQLNETSQDELIIDNPSKIIEPIFDKPAAFNEPGIWLNANKVPIVLGKNVCSFQENYFGIVKSVSSTGIDVTLLGQAKNIIEGIVKDATSGVLFSSMKNIYFLPQTGVKRFSKSDIAICSLE